MWPSSVRGNTQFKTMAADKAKREESSTRRVVVPTALFFVLLVSPVMQKGEHFALNCYPSYDCRSHSCLMFF